MVKNFRPVLICNSGLIWSKPPAPPIVTKEDGVVFKRAYNRIKENGTLLLVSLNPFCQPYEIKIKDVIEVWKFALKFSDQMVEEFAG